MKLARTNGLSRKSRMYISVAVVALSLALGTQAAHAQSTPSEESRASDAGEIVVTARRREELLSDVPIAITAIGAEELQQRQLQTEADIAFASPGLTIRQNGSANQFNYALRGQSVDTYSNSPPGVLPYINEAQIAGRSASQFYDMSSVQVLKGPQGTLFGRNATGGAVLFQTTQPGDVLEGYALARYGNYELSNLEAAATLPLGDRASLRLAGLRVQGGAFVHNRLTGEDLGEQDVTSLRSTLRIEPTSNVTNTTMLQYTNEGGTNVPTEIYSAYAPGETFNGQPLNAAGAGAYGPLNPTFNSFIAAHPNLFPHGVVAAAAAQRERGPWESDINVPIYHDAESAFLINTTEIDLGGDMRLKNIFSYNDSRSDDGYDYDGTPYPIFQTGGTPTADATSVTDSAGFIQETRQISNEIQLQGTTFGDRLDYVLGIYYLNQRDIADSNILGFDFSPVSAAVPFRYHQRIESESRAVFAQGTYALTGRLNFTAGARYTWETTTARQMEGSAFGTAFPEEELKSDEPSWTLSLDYQLTPDWMVYVAHRGSWRAGGYNYSVLPIDATAAEGGNRFDPETTRDVELGFKYAGTGFGVPVNFDIAIYNQWVDDIQRAAYVDLGLGPTIVTINVPRAEISGVEAHLDVMPVSWLSLGGAVAYTDARYTENEVNLFGQQNFYGPYADAPQWTGNLFAEASHDLSGDAGRLVLRTDVYAQSSFFVSNVANTLSPRTEIDGYTLVNARLSWESLLGSNVTAALFGRNIFEEEYYAGGNSLGPTLGVNTSVPGRPRMWGVELRIDF